MCHVTAKEGTALVFNHDTLHEGLPVRDGVKYIIRTEIMYHRVDREMIPDPMSYQSNENYLTTLALYQKSWQLEQGTCNLCAISDHRGIRPHLLRTLQQFCHHIYVYIYVHVRHWHTQTGPMPCPNVKP